MRLSLVCLLFDPAIPTHSSILFNCVYTCFYSFYCNLSMPSYMVCSQLLIKWKMGGAQDSLPRPSLTCIHIMECYLAACSTVRQQIDIQDVSVRGPSSAVMNNDTSTQEFIECMDN